MKRTRVLVCDGHPLWIETITSLLRPHFEIAGAVDDGAQLLAESLRLEPDVIITAILLPHLDGIEAVHRLTVAGSKARVVFLTMHTETEFVNACIAEGASGFIPKSEIQEHLIPAIRAAINGQTYILTPHAE